jgi:hypothetical protein
MPFLPRIDPEALDDDLWRLNGQTEFVLRRVLVNRGRLKERGRVEVPSGGPSERKILSSL